MVSLLLDKEYIASPATAKARKNGFSNLNAATMQLPRTTPLSTPTNMQLRFWGTRGSIPVSGLDYMRYGGNTSCVSLTSDSGHLFIFDCGSGARNLGNYLLSPEWQSRAGTANIQGYILMSHTHWDHIQGFPFFGPVFRAGNQFNIIGWGSYEQSLPKIMAGQMVQHYFPVGFDALPANLEFFSTTNLHSTFELDGIRVSYHLLNHPLPSLAYRLDLKDKALVYATDHEPYHVPELQDGVLLDYDTLDRKLVEFASEADILIHDAQYSATELPQKIGWGHSSIEVAVDTAIRAKVKQLILFHHDPNHTDGIIDLMLNTAHQRAASLGYNDLTIIAANDGLNLEL
jgi:ribonuclease BN (tRNA processing enzyme)